MCRLPGVVIKRESVYLRLASRGRVGGAKQPLWFHMAFQSSECDRSKACRERSAVATTARGKRVLLDSGST